MKVTKALKGRNVYGSGSFAPTKGRVSAQGAQGYLQRSIRQGQGTQALGGVRRIGSDGQSDTRSGLAAAAMQRRQGGLGGRQMQGGRQPFNNQGRPQIGGGKGPRNMQQGAQMMQRSAQQKAIPSVTVNANGQLELPYSPEWSQQMLESMGNMNVDLADLQSQQQMAELEYGQNTRDEKLNYTNIARQTLNKNAGSGTAFSSAYGVQATNDANAHQNQLNDLLAQHQAQQTAFDTQRTAMINAFKDQMRQAALANADTFAEKKGTLGYGQSKPKKKPGPNKPPKKGKKK